MSSTYSASYTSTYTEARARAVMVKVSTDLTVICNRGILSADRANRWARDIRFCLDKEALEFFELQFLRPDGVYWGLRYVVTDDGSLLEDSRAGGVDYYDLPDGTKVSIVLRLRQDRRARVVDQLAEWGWEFNGTMLSGDAVKDQSYSKDGYGMTRKKIGAWS